MVTIPGWRGAARDAGNRCGGFPYVCIHAETVRRPRGGLTFVYPHQAVPLNTYTYKCFAITARTFQIRGSGRWTLDILIGRHSRLRAFSNTTTYLTEQAAIAGCCDYARQIIDGRVENCSIRDLRTD